MRNILLVCSVGGFCFLAWGAAGAAPAAGGEAPGGGGGFFRNLFGRPAAKAETPKFTQAKPVWLAGREREMNVQAGFRALLEAPPHGKATLRLTASCLYRVFLNGAFVGHGPARGPHGFFRVDEWDLSGRLTGGRNLLAIEVAGYNVNSYYLLDQPSFLQAEMVTSEGKVLAATGAKNNGFDGFPITNRVQKTQRYSFQRPFSEVYHLPARSDRWRTDAEAVMEPAPIAIQPAVALLPRRVPYPEFATRSPVMRVAGGEIKTGLPVAQPWKDRSLTAIGPKLGGFPANELACAPSLELQGFANGATDATALALEPNGAIAVGRNRFAILDFGVNLTGFIGAEIECQKRARLFLTFDEILSNGDVNFKRLDCVNIIELNLEPGRHRFESLEPYTLRYLKIIALEADCAAAKIYLREYANPQVKDAAFAASDPRLDRLFQAARETFRQNATDLFMDCPSRERAGWLCDSYFTARAAFDLSGNTVVEKNFLENYLRPARFEHLPEGMLPMCYPADHNDGVFIPNWALWFVLELEEYADRSGDRPLVEALRGRVLKLLEYFRTFHNSDGLLEKLPGWVFVEWSKANSFVQDVNYPSNMLYARALAAAARLYNLPQLRRQADQIRETIRRQSFDGEFFVDNAVRKDGRLESTRNRTEVCQYFAFYFDVASPETHSGLWEKLARDFGPRRRETKAHPEVHPANAFIGNVLRLELLSRQGLSQQILDEAVAYHLYMADRTGTLWEHDRETASCNHGFASHLARVLNRDVLGVQAVDARRKTVFVRFPKVDLDWCSGSVPTPDGRLDLRWRKSGQRLLYFASAPRGYRVEIENASGLELAAE